MKKEFSTAWTASKQPRKQRKYRANAPLHLRGRLLSSTLDKSLKKKYGKRNLPVVKGDKVKVMIGKYAGKAGKVLQVKTKLEKVYIDGFNRKKSDGSMVLVPFKASNLKIVELNLNDKKRAAKLGAEVKKTEVKEEKKENKETNKKEESEKKLGESKK